jgi:hypothetical protein
VLHRPLLWQNCTACSLYTDLQVNALRNGKRKFLHCTLELIRGPDHLWGPSSLLSIGYEGSPPTSADVKKTWIYLYIHSPIRLHGTVLKGRLYLFTGSVKRHFSCWHDSCKCLISLIRQHEGCWNMFAMSLLGLEKRCSWHRAADSTQSWCTFAGPALR